MEMFAAFDDDGSDSLEKGEFADGLRSEGFFDQEDLPFGLASEEQVLLNLYPLLDSSNTGVIQPDQLLFLEKNELKRAKWGDILEKKRDGQFGAFAIEGEANEAMSLIKSTCFATTRCGKTHWKMVPYNPIMGGPPPRETRAVPMFIVNREKSESSPDLRKGPKPIPRFLKEFRQARKQGKLIGREARHARELANAEAEAAQARGLPPAGARPATSGPPGFTTLLDAELGLRPATSPPGTAPPPPAASFGLTPAIVGSAKLASSKWKEPQRQKLPVAWAKNHAEAHKITAARKAYCATFTPIPKKPDNGVVRQMEDAWTEPPAPRDLPRDLRPLEPVGFSPGKALDFFCANKALAMFDNYHGDLCQ